ncbi:hypothetical protein [Flavobacterium sp.]|uniref:hypothetical protein n=1 Tax=Flavobacterium sp. TaxID=239 RepID=UPI003752840A
MEITLQNYSKNINASTLKKSQKLIVRDIDELKPNSFVAYVDEDRNSYDVSIILSINKEIISSACDCGSKSNLCIHKIVFLNYLSAKGNVSNKIARKKKLTQAEEIISGIDVNILKNWVIQLLNKNKDLELLFVNEFSNDKKEFNSKEVKILIDNSIKSVIKNKKSIENSELKKIIDLLDVTLKPVVVFCEDNISKKEGLDLLFFIIDELSDFHNRYYLTSVKVERFVEKISNQVNSKIYLLKDYDKWTEIVDLIFETIFYDSKFSLTISTFNFVTSIYTNTSDNNDRRFYFAKKLEAFFLFLIKNNQTPSLLFSNFILDVLSENKLFESNFKYFKSFRYENSFNLKLIDALLEINKLEEAEILSVHQIRLNGYVEFNIEYWKRLKNIYSIQKNQTKLVEVLTNTVFFDFDFEGLMLIKANKETPYYNKFRSNLQGKVKRIFSKSKQAVLFYYQILNSENAYSKMIETICSYTNYDLLFEYKEEMYLTDKLAFLINLTDIESKWYSSKTINVEYREKLIFWILERYETIIIETFLKGKTRYGNSIFYEEFVKVIQAK